MSTQSIVVSWVDDAQICSLARKRGWNPDVPSTGEILDYCEESDAERTRDGFSSVTKAKAWASRNRALDLWRQPEISVYQWPDARKRSWERETVRHLRYQGDGDGWEELDCEAYS